MRVSVPTISLAVLSLTADVSGGVCEELDIPMETVEVPGVGWVCKVRECENPTTNEHGIQECVRCSQDGQSASGMEPNTDFCPLSLGECSGGRCVPKKDDYYERNFGKPWKGLGTFSVITATHYGGSMASGGYGPGFYDVDAVVPCFERLGIDGIAAVPAQMYGGASVYSQAAFKNNNLCYKLIGVEGVTRVVAITDRCGGYVQCSGGATPMSNIEEAFDFPEIERAPGATIWADANQCVINSGAKIYSGLGQRCWYFTDDSEWEGKSTCCPDACGSTGHTGKGQQVDWCGSQSHPHFDLPRGLLDALCDNSRGGGINAGSCALEWVEPIKCPVHPKAAKCCMGSCDDCTPKQRSCANDEMSCKGCGGTYCPGDSWENICTAPDADLPSPRPDWTPRPDDVNPADGPPHPITNKPPPAPDATSPSEWPFTRAPTQAPPAKTTTKPGETTTTQAGAPTTTQAGVTTTAGTNTTKPPGPKPATTIAPGTQEEKSKAAAPIAGAAAGAVAVLAAAGLGARMLSGPPRPIDAEFEGEGGEADDEEAREGAIRQESADFA